MAGPLEGIKVVDLSRLLPGGYCSMMLADLGADVVKVEEPSGGEPLRHLEPLVKKESSYFLALHRNKRSLALDLKTAVGKQVIRRLAEWGDVLLEGFRPDVAAQFGAGYDELKLINPRLIYCSISGFGQDGPYRSRSGHDANYLAISGILGITGGRSGGPCIPGVQIADIGCGGLMAAAAIMAALYSREKTGRGQYIDISMLDGAISYLSIHASKFFADGLDPQPSKMLLSGRYPSYNLYETKDSRHISLGAFEGKFWSNFCHAVGRPDLLAAHLAEGEEGDKAIAEVEMIFRERSLDEWALILKEIDVPWGPVNSFSEAFADPQVIHRRMVVEIDHPTEGRIKQLGIPIKFASSPGEIKTPPPSLGQHTGEILIELGYSKSEIERFKKEGIV